MRRRARSLIRGTGWLVRWKWPLLALGLALGGASWWVSRNLAYDHSVESLLAVDDPDRLAYEQAARLFGGDDAVVIAYADPAPLSAAGLQRASRLAAAAQQVNAVEWTLGAANNVFGRVLQLTGGERYAELMEGLTVGPDRRTAAVVCFLRRSSDHSQRLAAVESLRRVAREAGLEAVVAGPPVVASEGLARLEESGRQVSRLSLIMLFLTIIVSFRSPAAAFASIALVTILVEMSEAVLALSGMQLSMIGTMMTTIIRIIGVASAVHFFNALRSAQQRGWRRDRAIRYALAAIGPPIVWTCVTDAAGFGALCVSEVKPIRDYGLAMMLSTGAALAGMVLLLPGLGAVIGGGLLPRSGRIDALIHAVMARIRRAAVPLSWLLVLVSLAAAAGMYRVRVEHDFMNSFRAGSAIRNSYEFAERRLGGAGVWDVLIPTEQPLDWELMGQVRQLESQLREQLIDIETADPQAPRLTKVIGLPDLLDAMPKLLGNRLPLPMALTTISAVQPELTEAFWTRDAGGKYWLRVMLRARESQPLEQKLATIQQVTDLARQAFPESQVTGSYVLLARAMEKLRTSQLTVLLAALGSVGLVMWLALGSFRLALASCLPNVLPVLAVTGAMGWLDKPLNMGAAMSAGIALGISVDASIHFLTSYLRRRRVGLGRAESIRAAQQQVVTPIVLATVSLVAGFGALSISDFTPTSFFGVSVSLCMAGGLLGNLALLPVLIAGRAVAGAAERK